MWLLRAVITDLHLTRSLIIALPHTAVADTEAVAADRRLI